LLQWQRDTVEGAVSPVEPFALFGLRACEVAAVAYLDRFFADDPFYERRRAHALLVGANCLAACPGGFCEAVGAGPFAHGGCDLVLTPLSDGRVFVETGTTRGDDLLTAVGPAARPADGADVAARDRAEARARATFAARGLDDLRRAIARIDAGDVTGVEWQAVGAACFACTGCTNLCPTCSCFAVVDEPHDGGGVRTRQWDSCLLEGFQREASGHHPAPRPGDRVRRFWYHKLSRDFVPRGGRIGCVGCGRCDVTCPGAIGARQVLGRLGAP
jgi:formate hydrogenlyase subunit 6/NADH:ubiquinone oxidoreductase subunit I